MMYAGCFDEFSNKTHCIDSGTNHSRRKRDLSSPKDDLSVNSVNVFLIIWSIAATLIALSNKFV